MQCADDINAIKSMLISSVDKNFNVIDQDRLNQILSLLESYPMTQAELEKTRIGKYINEVRKKTADTSLAKRAKELVKKWQRVINSHAGKANTDSPRSSLSSAILTKTTPRVSTPNNSNSCSPTSDYTASPALCANFPKPQQNGIKSATSVCSCASFEEHSAKCENPIPQPTPNGNSTSVTTHAIECQNHRSNSPEQSVEKSDSSAIIPLDEPQKFHPKTEVAADCIDSKTNELSCQGQAKSHVKSGVQGTVGWDGTFKEWDEVVELGTDAEPLFALPYTVID